MQDMCALVVDDSKVGRLTMMKKLEAMGLKVELAESGQQALTYLAQHRPDMIFMDHMMPEMDGFEVTRRIKASPATHDIPVIIISGNDEASFIEEARAAGAIDAIAKPPATGVLEKLLASLPKLSAEAPTPVAAKPAPAPSIDMAEVQALVERLIGAAVTPLRDDFMAEMGQRLEAESGNQRKTLADWQARQDQQAASIAELRHSATKAETLDNRLHALEQRLIPLEAEVARPQPDFNALQADIEQRVAARLDQYQAEHQAKHQSELQSELNARMEGLAPQLENLRRDFQETQARADAYTAQVEQRASERDSRLNTYAEQLAKLSQDMQTIHADQAEIEHRVEQHIAQMRETLNAAQQVAAPLPESVSEQVDSETSGKLQDIQAELGELRERLSESRLQQLVAETVRSLQPVAEAERVATQPEAPPQVNASLQAELTQLRSKVKTLTIATAVGAALLLAVIGMAVFGG